MKLSSFRISTRLQVTFAAILVLMGGIIAIGSRAVSATAANMFALSDTLLPKIVQPSNLGELTSTT